MGLVGADPGVDQFQPFVDPQFISSTVSISMENDTYQTYFALPQSLKFIFTEVNF
jgi:hypothetical protein